MTEPGTGRLRCGVLAAWTRAWIAGRVSLDQAIDAVTAGDGVHTVTGLPGFADEPVTLREVLVAWRRAAERVELALPVPGDVRGTPGPVALRAAALEAGEAVAAPGLGIVPAVVAYAPSSAPPTVTWRAFPAEPAPPDPLTVREAQHDLADAIRECASAITASGAGGASRQVTALLGDARRAGDRPNLPPGSDPPAVALLAQAERLQAVLELAGRDPLGGAADVHGAVRRADALRPLLTAVRRGRLAAYNA